MLYRTINFIVSKSPTDFWLKVSSLLSFQSSWLVDMAAMLSGGQKFGLLSTTLNNTSSISNINEFGNSNFDGSLTDGLLGEGGTSRKPGSHSNSKSVVLVKLTDSALKAIAEYVKQRVSKFQYYSIS